MVVTGSKSLEGYTQKFDLTLGANLMTSLRTNAMMRMVVTAIETQHERG
jgi:hypothetical protein